MKRVSFFAPMLAVLAILQGCAPSNPGVARLGNNQYILTRQATGGFHGLGAVKLTPRARLKTIVWFWVKPFLSPTR